MRRGTRAGAAFENSRQLVESPFDSRNRYTNNMPPPPHSKLRSIPHLLLVLFHPSPVMRILPLVAVYIASLNVVYSEKIDVKELKCLVCRRVVEEMEKDIDKVDPKKTVEVGTYRIDHKGDQKQKTVEYRRSEVYLTEMMERICNRMDDYVRARMKSNGQLVVIPLMTETGSMSPFISEVDIIQDSDLNKSLKFYCEGILEENEEGFMKLFSRNEDNLDIKLCSGVAKLCDQSLDQDYQFEEHEEL